MIPSKNQNNICAVIPFYNEEKHIRNVVENVLNYVDLLILVNDGSTDNSLSFLPTNDKIILINHPNNLGKGAALKTGFKKSIEANSKITVSIDGDNQHDPKFIPDLIKESENYDCVIGNRKRSATIMPIHRKISNYLTSKILSIKTGIKILDSQSGFRVFKTNILPNVLPDYFGFEAESEMIIKICKNNYSVGFREISTIYGNDNSKMKAIPTILGFIKVIVKA